MSEIWGEYVGVMKICVGIPPVSRATKNLWLTRFGQMWAYLFEKVSVGVKSGMRGRFGNLSLRVREQKLVWSGDCYFENVISVARPV